MLRRLALALLLCTIAGAAHALPTKYFHLSPYGSTSNTGRDSANAWPTITYANSQTAGGVRAHTNFGGVDSNVVFLLHACGPITGPCEYAYSTWIYDSIPNPRKAPSGGARYTYQYAGDVTGAIKEELTAGIQGGLLRCNDVTFRGLRIEDGLTIGPTYGGSFTGGLRDTAWFDSVAQCWFTRDNFTWAGCKYAVIQDCLLEGPRLQISPNSPGWQTRGNTMADCKLLALTSNNDRACAGSAYNSSWAFYTGKYTDSCTFARNHFKITNEAGLQTGESRKHFFTTNATFKNNRYDIIHNATCGDEYDWIVLIRDSSNRWVCKSESLFISGSNTNSFSRFSGSGAEGLNGYEHVHQFLWDSLYYRHENALAGLDFQGELASFTMTNSVVVVGHGAALRTDLAAIHAPVLFDHNTFIGMPNYCWPNSETDPEGCNTTVNEQSLGVFQLATASNRWFYGPNAADSIKFTNNFVGAWWPESQVRSSGPQDRPAGLYVNATEAIPGAKYLADWNYYWIKPYLTTRGDWSIGYHVPNQFPAYRGSRPGSGQAYNVAWPNSEARSAKGYALFGPEGTDTTFASFVPEIPSTAQWRGLGKSGTDIGARTYTAAFVEVNKLVVTLLGDVGNVLVDTVTVYVDGPSGSVSFYGLGTSDPAVTASLLATTVAAGSSTRLAISATVPASGRGAYSVFFSTTDGSYPLVTITVGVNPAGGSGVQPPPGFILDP